MTAATTCPKPERLEQFLLGKLDDETTAGLEEHLQECTPCGAALPSLAAEDSLVAAMKARAGIALPAGESALVEELTCRLTRQGLGELGNQGDTMGEATQGGGPTAASPDERFDFLAPAQRPDELGRLGAYRVLKVLGRGGMGVVFLAEDAQLQRPVALKVMLPEIAQKATARERFLREGRAAAGIEHDHIVTIHHVSEENGVPFLVMPLLKGESLDDRLKQGEQPALAEILRLGREIAAGLAAAHGHGLIHRDVKPANIWLDAGADGRVKILDFGLARPTQDETHLTHSGVIVGTPSFMAPEQASGKVIDGRADLWSLGCVLYRLCTGRLPFQAPDMMATLMQAALEPATPPRQLNPGVPPALDDLVMRLLAKDPKDRPASAQAVVEEIRKLEHRLSAIERGEFTQEITTPVMPSRRRRWLAAAVLFLLCGGLLAGGIVYVQTDKGLLKIEALDDDVKVVVEQNGKLVTVLDRKNGTEVVLRSGEYTVRVGDENKNVKVDKATVRITRGETAVATITRVAEPIVVDPRPAPVVPVDKTLEEWIARVQKLPAAEQLKTVTEKMIEMNPGFDGNILPEVESDAIVGLKFTSNAVSDLTPLRALPKLRRLKATGSGPIKGKLADLTPLKDLPLELLWVWDNPISDLSPLQRMPLTDLELGGCAFLSDLKPLRGLPLRTLVIQKTAVADLTPLAGMPLESLRYEATPVKDVLPIRYLPLRYLGCTFEPSRDTAVLKDLWTVERINQTPIIDFWKQHDPAHAAFLQWSEETKKLTGEQQLQAIVEKLKEVNPGFDGKVQRHGFYKGRLTKLVFSTNEVADLRPLIAAPELSELDLRGDWPLKGKVRDLSPLSALRKLKVLYVDYNPVQDLAPLRGLPLQHLAANGGKFRSLRPLEGMPLKKLYLSAAYAVKDLVPLRAAPLEELHLNVTGVEDLTPLEGLMLRQLDIRTTNIWNLDAVKRFPKLKQLECRVQMRRDAPIFKSLWTVEKINEQPILDFWKQHDKDHAAFLEWIAATQKLSGEEQVAAVKAKLLERNPGAEIKFDAPKFIDGKVSVFSFAAADVTDLAPIRAFTDLRLLNCAGTPNRLSKLRDLSPLRGMRIEKLYIGHSAVTDLTPLRGMPLVILNCVGTSVQDLSPLTTMPLQELSCEYKPERDAVILRSIPTLQTINDKPRAEFFDAKSTALPPLDPAWLKMVAALPAKEQGAGRSGWRAAR